MSTCCLYCLAETHLVACCDICKSFLSRTYKARLLYLNKFLMAEALQPCAESDPGPSVPMVHHLSPAVSIPPLLLAWIHQHHQGVRRCTRNIISALTNCFLPEPSEMTPRGQLLRQGAMMKRKQDLPEPPMTEGPTSLPVCTSQPQQGSPGSTPYTPPWNSRHRTGLIHWSPYPTLNCCTCSCHFSWPLSHLCWQMSQSSSAAARLHQSQYCLH